MPGWNPGGTPDAAETLVDLSQRAPKAGARGAQAATPAFGQQRPGASPQRKVLKQQCGVVLVYSPTLQV